MHTRQVFFSVVIGFSISLLAGGILLAGALGYRSGVLELGTAFSFLRWGAYTGMLAGAVSAVGVFLALAWCRRVETLMLGISGVLVGSLCYGLPAQQQALARRVPPIHDITTDTRNPPAFVAVLPLREGSPNTSKYDPEVAAQQQEAYPDVVPIKLDVSPKQAFVMARRAVSEMGWELVSEVPAEGRIEATATTFWFGFKDDVVVRVRPSVSGSVVDVRSVSRVGRSDVGANAKRVREYAEYLMKP